jgi:hypothetical protein
MLRWIRAWRRRRNGIPTPGQQAAQDALYRAECAREVAHERSERVAETAAVLREERRANHFAERIQMLLLEGGHQT